ncbi:odorant receptor 67d-like [Bradysia coprophila]|uniref:odorant receptor 67d-like n=1 Tax=Bradysia coprophila TaxID=38358 RepID=UPI00187D9440|nr:odorant receptor 67d-like [Bradysia coprophila]
MAFGNKSSDTINRHDIENASNSVPKPKSNHYEVFNKIYSINLFYGTVVGLSIESSWKYNNGTRWTKFMLIFGTGITIYSHLLVITEPTKLIEVFSLFGIIIPAFAKFNLFVRTYSNAMAFSAFLRNVFKTITEGPSAFVLQTHVEATFTIVKLCIFVQTFALFVFVWYPIYSYIFNNELVPIMPMQFPFVDQTTTGGFIVAALMMLKMGVWAYFGSVGFDLFLASLIDNYCALVKLLQQDLSDYIRISRKGSGYSEQYKKAFFRNFLMKCQDKDRFIQLVNDAYADVIFKQFGMVYVCLNFTIYAIIRSNWYSGYGILLFGLTELYILCILGTAIKTENDNFSAAVYDIPWYEYPLTEQKKVLLLLHSSQNAMELWIGPVAPLNVESAMEITKSIYSTSTMIINTTE